MLWAFQLTVVQVLFRRLLTLFALISVGQLTRFLSLHLKLLSTLFLIPLLLASTYSGIFDVLPFTRAELNLIGDHSKSLLVAFEICGSCLMIRWGFFRLV